MHRQSKRERTGRQTPGGQTTRSHASSHAGRTRETGKGRSGRTPKNSAVWHPAVAMNRARKRGYCELSLTRCPLWAIVRCGELSRSDTAGPLQTVTLPTSVRSTRDMSDIPKTGAPGFPDSRAMCLHLTMRSELPERRVWCPSEAGRAHQQAKRGFGPDRRPRALINPYFRSGGPHS